MISEDFRYYRGSRESRETVELDIVRSDGMYITTCVVNVDLLLCGIALHPCGNGDDRKLDPEQQLKVLEFTQAERKKITDSYPVKTYKGWHESGLPTFEDYCFPGDEVDDAMVEHFINSVPPALARASCTQGGEEYSIEFDERSGRNRNTYITFHRIGEGHWVFDGYCFYAENENRHTEPSRIQQLISSLRRSTK